MKLNRVVYPLKYDSPYWKNNYSFLKGYIMSTLGHPITRVELTETHLIQSIHAAISQYYKSREATTDLEYEVLDLDSDNEAVIPPTIDSSLIRDVFFTEASNAFGTVSPIDEGVVATFPLTSFMQINGGVFNLGQYYMARQNLQDADIITGRQKHWTILNGKIKVFPQKIGAEYKRIAILYGKLLDPEDLESDEWIRDYSVAFAKTILGTIRRKFSGMPMAGGAGTSDGDALIAEGKQEMADLSESAKNSRPAVSWSQF